jgi:hypothetical protein
MLCSLYVVFKVEEMVNLKEKFRAEVRKELEDLERRYITMASILRELGVVVEGAHAHSYIRYFSIVS